MTKIFLLLFSLNNIFASSSIAGFRKIKNPGVSVNSAVTINDTIIKNWIAPRASSYMGPYHFGESEGEWDLLILPCDTLFVAQATGAHYDESLNRFVPDFKTYHNVMIKGNKLTADSLQGIFVNWEVDGKIFKGLYLNEPRFAEKEFGEKAEYGLSLKEWLEGKYHGNYPQLSYKLIDESYFKTKSKGELQLMRNEIFARYGLRFSKNGKMYNHFIKQDWYRPLRVVLTNT